MQPCWEKKSTETNLVKHRNNVELGFERQVKIGNCLRLNTLEKKKKKQGKMTKKMGQDVARVKTKYF